MPEVTFEAELALAGRTTTMVRCPFDVRATFGRARPAVLVTIGEHTYRATTAIFGDAWFLPVPADARDAVGIGPGDLVQLTVEEDAAPRSVRTVIVTGVLINILNPKLTIFFFAFLPQFVSADGSTLAPMVGLSLVFMGLTFVVFAIYGLFAAAVRRHVVPRPSVMAWLRRTFAASFVALSARLALQQR